MANYYNVTLWKHTGFNELNRPFSREVLNQDYFLDPQSHYSQMQGIAVNREDMTEISYIDLQGSIKDLQGEQVNAPNATGSQGPNGPWYSYEEVDYVRLVRTGYTGDVDFIDISNNQTDPWNADFGGKKDLRIAYYFVTGLEPKARNVTRIYLSCDYWTTCGASDELEIEAGFKTRGMITDAEDAESYNLASEDIGITEPLEVKGHADVNSDDGQGYNTILITSIDMNQYSEEQTTGESLKPQMDLDAFMAVSKNGNSTVIPTIKSIDSTPLSFVIWDPVSSTSNNYNGYGAYDYTNSNVLYNVSVLYSLGQLELQNNYKLPKLYAEPILGEKKGRLNAIWARTSTIDNPLSKDIGTYPRKADYSYGQEILYSKLSGDMNSRPFPELNDDGIYVWAIPSPNGYPIARFKDIKGHPYIYDSICKGMQWEKASVIVEGANGSYWAQSQMILNSQNRESQYNYLKTIGSNLQDKQALEQKQALLGEIGSIAGGILAGAGAAIATGGVGAIPIIAAGVTGGIGVAKSEQKRSMLDITQQQELDAYQKQQRDFLYKAQMQQLDEQKALAQSPSVYITPDMDNYNKGFNGFSIYIVNTSAKDRERLKNYYRHYGYRGLYKALTFDEINVKKRVNYIEAENVVLKHQYYSMRALNKVSNVLSSGLWLWNERPNQQAFNDNEDN